MIPDTDTEAERQAQILVEAAYWAQAELASFGQDRIDRICEAMSGAALRDAARLGKMAVKETGYGVPGDKEEKTASPPKTCGTIFGTYVPSASSPKLRTSWRFSARGGLS
jgi:hypothetical protein